MAPKSVLITGCSVGGIGHALVLAFQKRGLKVFATARSVEKMQDLGTLSNVVLLSLDVTDPASVAAAVKQVEVQTGGSLDILINNAGQLYVMPALDIDIAKAKDIFEVNYWAPLRLVQEFSPMLMAAKGSIVNVGSSAGLLPLPFQSQYNASKAALNLLSENLRLELAPLGVKVITLVAGNTISNIGTNAPPPPSLPPSSPYLPIEKIIAKQSEFSDMPTEKFAESLVQTVLGGASGAVWLGSNTAVVRYAMPLMPQWMFDKIMISLGRGLDKMPRRTCSRAAE